MSNRLLVRGRGLLTAALVAVSLGACSDDGGSTEELCGLVEDSATFSGRFDEGLDPTDTDRALSQLRSVRADLGRFRAAAPSEVDDALDDEITYVDSLIEVIETVDPEDPAAVVNAVNALEEERAAADVAALELQAFQEERC